MTRHYSTKDFFRQMPNALLARYFQGHGLLGDLDFAAMKEAQPDELFTAWLELPDGQRNAMDADFRDIFEMSCEKGFRAIRDEAEWHLAAGTQALAEFVGKLAALASHYERAIVTFLDHSKVLEWGNPLLSRRHVALLAQAEEPATPACGAGHGQSARIGPSDPHILPPHRGTWQELRG
jgi:hypothetical protein